MTNYLINMSLRDDVLAGPGEYLSSLLFHNSGANNRRRQNNQVFLLIIALSLLIHLALLMLPGFRLYSLIPMNLPSEKRLTIHIQAAKQPAQHIKQTHPATSKSKKVIPTRQPVTNKNSTLRMKKTEPALQDQHNRVIEKRKIITHIYQSLPEVARDMTKQQSGMVTSRIFDPELRNKIAAARKAKAQQQANARLLVKKPRIKITGEYGDYVGIRIDGHCLRVPIKDGLEQFDSRITMQEFTCAKKKVRLFAESPLLQPYLQND